MSEGMPPAVPPSEGYAELLKQIAELNEKIAGLNERVKGLEERIEERQKTTEEREKRQIAEAMAPQQQSITEIRTSIRNLKWFVGISVAFLSVLIGLVTLLSRLGIL